MILANDAKESENGPIGDPTETALLDFLLKTGLQQKIQTVQSRLSASSLASF